MRCLRLLNVLYKVDESFKYPLHGLAQIAEQMEPVCDLDSLRRSLPATVCVCACPVSADDLHSRMSLQPFGECL